MHPAHVPRRVVVWSVIAVWLGLSRLKRPALLTDPGDLEFSSRCDRRRADRDYPQVPQGWQRPAAASVARISKHAGRSLRKDLETLDAAFVIDTFLLLLIGIGPKIALVPFLEATAAMPEAVKLVIAVAMVLGHQTGSGGDHPVEGRDPMQVAVYPLAVPYLLNPAGIVVLVTLSAEASSIAVLAVGVGVLVAVLAFDVAVFRWAVRVSSKLDASRMLVTEKVFGFLLAALGVQLVLNGLSDVGVIHLTTGR
jgi:multiple antibiotic resistance protein